MSSISLVRFHSTGQFPRGEQMRSSSENSLTDRPKMFIPELPIRAKHRCRSHTSGREGGGGVIERA